MSLTLESITHGTVDRPPRIVLLGTEKIGKSTFASQAPNPIIAPVAGEEGVDALDVAKLPLVTNYNQLLESINLLIQSEHSYETFIIDSTSTLETLIWEQVCLDWNVKEIESAGPNGGGFGKGYLEAAAKWGRMMKGLDILRDKGMTVILIGHVIVASFNDPLSEPYSVYEWDVNKRARAPMFRWADCILFANTRITIKTKELGFNQEHIQAVSTGERYLYTQSRPSHPGGGRGVYGQLPYEMPLDWASWEAAVAAQEQAQQ